MEFQVDDGVVRAHRALLMVRGDVMYGMFSYNFKESSAKLVRIKAKKMKIID